MRYKSVQDLIDNDTTAKDYFETLSEDVKSALLTRGEGVNNLSELKHFADIIESRGYVDTTDYMNQVNND